MYLPFTAKNKKESIRHKLLNMSMATSFIAVLLTSILFVIYGSYITRNSVINELILIKEMVGNRSAASLEWGDNRIAQESLETLKVKKSIKTACIYNDNKEVFASYFVENNGSICPKDNKYGTQVVTSNAFVIYDDIFFENQKVGSIYIQSDLRDFYREIPKYILFALCLMVGIIYIAYFISLFYEQHISKPILELASITETIVKEGNYSVSAKKYANDEIGTLTTSFNKVMALTHNLKTNLEDMVTERTQELEKALQAKSNFLSNMSHEIRTPNHAVMNCSIYVDSFLQEIISNLNQLKENITADKLIEDTANLVQEAYEFNLRVRSASERQGHLLNNILDLSKMGEGKLETNMQPNELLKVVNSVLAESEGLYKNGIKDIEVVFNEPKIDTTAEFDYQRMTQVISNLFGNAVKYSPSGTLTLSIKNKSIEIEGKKVSGLMFSIADQGLGIPSGELESIFEKFTEGSHTKQQSGGTGIGLAICRDIIELHNGRIWAKNNKGKGSCFTFVIPRTQPVKQEK